MFARFLRRPAAILSLTAALVWGHALARAEDRAGDFDYYVLSLSWSPSYCAAKGRDADPTQCRAAKPFGFIVHGLWPQYERGWPDFCRTDMSGPTRAQVESVLDIMPSRGLINHEWRKHGTCSGLSAGEYLETLRAAFEKIRIPPALKNTNKTYLAAPETVEKAFRLANPGLNDAAMAVTCSRGEIDEVRICFTRDLKFRSCKAVDRAGCRATRIKIPPPVR
ncbi:ribonuclease T2 family protein [Roseibium litorale]|uniref:Ribonuclease T2 n=1 Tax=Roseibium litorale TaxID=2803841 RepID=A0ABR9CKR6_9HYPH|nr:ribonuclease T2 [Roseibium litorale]MBD8891421.1 ribonuclease T2 [Roseibium litorale]